jgi:hypothetical protein
MVDFEHVVVMVKSARLVQVLAQALEAQLGWPPEVDSPTASHPPQIVHSFLLED